MTVLPFRTDTDIDAAIPVVGTHLHGGGLLAYPTETVYGLGSRADADDLDALSALKGRPAGKPFLLLVADRDMPARCGLEFNHAAMALADHFWPGPLTLVLPGAHGVLPNALRGPEGGIAVRWTSHEGMARLIAGVEVPITSTSANRPGGPTAPGPGAIVDAFGDAVAKGALLVLDGGVLGNLPPSTVVDCTQEAARLIREGAIPLSEIRQAVGSFAP
jgi:L-threonylcarbamoyladenylate synthase